jgi:hypothetical protein
LQEELWQVQSPETVLGRVVEQMQRFEGKVVVTMKHLEVEVEVDQGERQNDAYLDRKEKVSSPRFWRFQIEMDESSRCLTVQEKIHDQTGDGERHWMMVAVEADSSKVEALNEYLVVAMDLNSRNLPDAENSTQSFKWEIKLSRSSWLLVSRMRISFRIIAIWIALATSRSVSLSEVWWLETDIVHLFPTISEPFRIEGDNKATCLNSDYSTAAALQVSFVHRSGTSQIR